VQKVNILEETRLLLELNSYCSETHIVGLSELLKSLLKNTLEDKDIDRQKLKQLVNIISR
ncbi:hypothetical protein ACTPEF_26130, partial [Clostridioides difficile]